MHIGPVNEPFPEQAQIRGGGENPFTRLNIVFNIIFLVVIEETQAKCHQISTSKLLTIFGG